MGFLFALDNNASIIYQNSMSNINSKKSRRAVSPIVAVLILIVVAVVGGGAVAVLMGQIGSDTSKQASSGATADKASNTITIGGSSTVFPMTEALAPAFTAQTGIKIIDAQGGSGAGMTGVDQGALDIGATSSLSTYQTEAKNHPLDNLQAFEVAGSGLVVIAPTAGYIHPAAIDCTTITKAALTKIYNTGGGAFTVGACTNGIITLADVTITGLATDIQPYHRSDPSGTEQTFTGYIGVANPAPAGIGADGNGGVFTKVSTAAAGKAIGFVDIGFAKDNSANVALTNIMGVIDTDANGAPNLLTATPVKKGASTLAADTADFPGISTTNIESAIKSALGQLNLTSPNAHYPLDATGTNAGLVRTMYYVTKGAPSSIEQKFIDFVRSTDTNSQGLGVVDKIHSVGYYSYSEFAG